MSDNSKHQPAPPWSYDTPQKLQEYLNSHDPSRSLHLSAEIDFILARFGHSLFENIDFPQVKYLGLNHIKNLESLQYFKFPDSLTELVVRSTGLKSLITFQCCIIVVACIFTNMVWVN